MCNKCGNKNHRDLTILKIRDNIPHDPRFDNLPEELLKPPFLLVVNGSVRSGKSVLIQNLLFNDSMYRDRFDNIVYISPTVHNDASLQHMREMDDILMCDDPEQLDTVLQKVVELQKENADNHTLIIIDDCLGYIKRGSYLTYLCTRYRHWKISLIITSQDFRSVSNIIRANASGYILYKTPNKKELQKLEDEFESIVPEFRALYDYATNELYNFLFINLRNLDVYHNFTKKLYDKSKNKYML
jgi:hypothetical protein